MIKFKRVNTLNYVDSLLSNLNDYVHHTGSYCVTVVITHLDISKIQKDLNNNFNSVIDIEKYINTFTEAEFTFYII